MLEFCQRLVWYFVVDDPALASQQYGQEQIIRTLFRAYLEAVSKPEPRRELIPLRLHNELDEVGATAPKGVAEVRLVVDVIASLTDDQAASLYQRLTGVSSGSIVGRILLVTI